MCFLGIVAGVICGLAVAVIAGAIFIGTFASDP